MTDPTRGGRLRRGGRRPGWILMTVLLVLAIAASSALVFTNRVELLKLAVILALWAAVVAAFVSVIYRRQSDSDQAKVRDLKLVYDLQLDREISARREYELAVESHLRRELATELRAQSSDEVAALRAELAALRANLEYLFDADLSHRPAIENERTAGRVSSSRIDTEDSEPAEEDVNAPETVESPIIDVPVEPHPPEGDWAPQSDEHRGAHRRSGEQVAGGRRRADEAAEWGSPAQQEARPQEARPQEVPPHAQPPHAEPVQPEPQFPWLPPTPPQPARTSGPAGQWQPVPAEGQWIPAGEPGSNWVAPQAGGASRQGPDSRDDRENVQQESYVGRRRAAQQPAEPPVETPAPSEAPAPAETPAHADAPAPSEAPRGKHSAAGEEPSITPPPAVEPAPEESDSDGGGAHIGGQSVADLMARLQAAPSGGGRRRRRED